MVLAGTVDVGYGPGMVTVLDHVVWATADLPSLVDRVAHEAGVTPVEGGRHPGLGVRNFLLGLGERRYLELLGPDEDQLDVDRRLFAVDTLPAPVLASWAARTTALDDAVAGARASGYDPGDPRDMSRRRPDGSRVEWRFTPPEHASVPAVPFMIDWLDTDHPSRAIPALQLRRMVIGHPDPEALRKVLVALGLDDPMVDVEAADGELLRLEVATPKGTVWLA